MSVWTQQQAVLSQHRVYPVPPPLCSRVLLCLGGGKMVLNVMLVDRFFLLVQFLHDPLKKRPRHKQFHFDAYE